MFSERRRPALCGVAKCCVRLAKSFVGGSGASEKEKGRLRPSSLGGAGDGCLGAGAGEREGGEAGGEGRGDASRYEDPSPLALGLSVGLCWLHLLVPDPGSRGLGGEEVKGGLSALCAVRASGENEPQTSCSTLLYPPSPLPPPPPPNTPRALQGGTVRINTHPHFPPLPPANAGRLARGGVAWAGRRGEGGGGSQVTAGSRSDASLFVAAQKDHAAAARRPRLPPIAPPKAKAAYDSRGLSWGFRNALS